MAALGDAASARSQPARVQSAVLAVGVAATAALALVLLERGLRMVALLLVGVLLGVTLYHAAFGFSAAYRRLFLQRDVRAVLAQLLMLAAATCLFAPVLAAGGLFGRSAAGAVAPLGVQVAVGAFMFGIGMQLAGGCGSGTLYTVGGGSMRMVLTLATFVAGSFWASLHMPWWQSLPSLAPVVLGQAVGWGGAVVLQLGVLGALALLLWRWGRAAPYPVPTPAPVPASTLRRLAAGPWSLLAGALLLAGLNLLTLLLAGHPWTITWAFTLWGAKLATLLGWEAGSAGFWAGGFQQAKLAGSVLDDITSMMDVGIMLGALCAAALAGRFAPRLGFAPRSLAAAAIGGLAMGYGARIAFGCNIGAFFSGVASTSLHGWLWIVAALAGTWVGVRLRPRFGLANG